jgi:hypothetical protein
LLGRRKMQRPPVDHDLSAAHAEKTAEIDHGSAHLPTSIDQDIDDTAQVLPGTAADLLAQRTLNVVREQNGGAIPALKAARTAFTWPRVRERTARAGRTLEDSFFFRDPLGVGFSLALAARPDGSLPRRFASSSAAVRSDASSPSSSRLSALGKSSATDTGATTRPCRPPPPLARRPGSPPFGEALEPTPLGTDLLSGVE